MLQTGELVGLLAEIVQQPLQQPRRDLSAGDLDRPFDDPFVLLASQARNQELAPIDHLGQTFELTALADEVRTHGQHDIDRHFLLRRRFQQQADELVGNFLLPLARFVEAEDLLELIDDQQKVGSRAQVGLLDRFDQAEVTAAQSGQQVFAGVFFLAIVEVGVEQRVGQERQRIAAGMRDGDLPRGAGVEHAGRPAVPRAVRSGPATTCRCPRCRRPPRSGCCPSAVTARSSVLRGRRTGSLLPG